MGKENSKNFVLGGPDDFRLLENGRVIPSEYYADQPYIVKTDDGAWLCCITTGKGAEGASVQHVVTMKSFDEGKTWSEPVNVEPDGSPENSYAVMAKAPDGRVFIFYNFNADNIRKVKADNPPYTDGYCTRVDSLGHFVFRCSTDNGESWGERNYDIPMRSFEIDKSNAYGGELKLFWNVGKPFILDGAVYVSVHKVGGFGIGFFTRSEGVLLKSENLLTEKDPGKAVWETLPDGEYGLSTPPGGGSISEEQSYVVLSDKSIYSVYRTVDGFPCETYSRDKAHTFETPAYKKYDDGRPMRHPRAANFVWKCSNGKYVYWYHNHGGFDYDWRNPVWVSGGIEEKTHDGMRIRWSQPEMLLYDDDVYIRISYPDLVEQDGKYFVTETQKGTARLHPIPAQFFEKLWGSFDVCGYAPDAELDIKSAPAKDGKYDVGDFPEFNIRNEHDSSYGKLDTRNGVTFDFEIDLSKVPAGEKVTLFGNLSEKNRGFKVELDEKQNIVLYMSDAQTASVCTLFELNDFKQGPVHNVSIVVDSGPHIVSFVVDGRFCDGGGKHQFGFARFSEALKGINAREPISVYSATPEELAASGETLCVFSDAITDFKVYYRALMTCEAIGNHRQRELDREEAGK